MKSLIRHTKLWLKSSFRDVSPEYASKLKNEQLFYQDCTNVHDLPEIFHYWSNKYLATDMARFGFTNPDDFFASHSIRVLSRDEHKCSRILSIGSGNCDLEMGIAGKLIQAGLTDFTIECLDINEHMLERGKLATEAAGLSQHFVFTRGDFNSFQTRESYAVVLANQSLHHVLELEHLFDTVKKSLQPHGLFLVSDMIGRNGHLRWPEALEEIKPFWSELPETYRYNQLLNRYEEEYINHDCSVDGFEGIRAQDILPLLLAKFEFEFFYPYGNIIFAFVDRPIGHHFDATADWDRDFIDRVHAQDEAGLISGRLTPTAMMAVLTKNPVQTVLRHETLSPAFCVRNPDSALQ